MCEYCDINSDKCCVFADSLTNDWYLNIETSQWDQYNDGWVYHREYINYCPYCGRRLENIKADTEERLKKLIFDDEKMVLPSEANSCDFHFMTHEDTEILGQFCDFTGIHGDQLRNILVKSLL